MKRILLFPLKNWNNFITYCIMFSNFIVMQIDAETLAACNFILSVLTSFPLHLRVIARFILKSPEIYINGK